jgi:hypothetical protein
MDMLLTLDLVQCCDHPALLVLIAVRILFS